MNGRHAAGLLAALQNPAYRPADMLRGLGGLTAEPPPVCCFSTSIHLASEYRLPACHSDLRTLHATRLSQPARLPSLLRSRGHRPDAHLRARARRQPFELVAA